MKSRALTWTDRRREMSPTISRSVAQQCNQHSCIVTSSGKQQYALRTPPSTAS